MTAIPTEDLKNLSMKALTKAGLRPEDATITTDHYLENEISGKTSHGMVRIIEAVKRITTPATKAPTIEHDTGSMVRFNAGQQIGPVAGLTAMNEAIKRAKEHGIAMIGIHNYVANSGSMTYYLRRIADTGLIAFMGCNSIALVAPPNGRDRIIGTNPIGACIPGENDLHFIADLATSAYAYGKIMVHKDKNEPVPEGVMIAKDGSPSTDPKDAETGAILPMSGYKGFSLGLMIELMAGPLIGAKSIKSTLSDEDGLFIIAINPKAMGNSAFYSEITAALSTIKQSTPITKGDSIALPGERSAQKLQKTLETGTVDVAENTLNKLKDLAA